MTTEAIKDFFSRTDGKRRCFFFVEGAKGDEICAMLWSYAAIKVLNLPEEIVFHAGGYRGHSSWLVDHFREKQNYIGLPLLEWMGMTAGPEKAKMLGVPPYPHMIHWLRPS